MPPDPAAAQASSISTDSGIAARATFEMMQYFSASCERLLDLRPVRGEERRGYAGADHGLDCIRKPPAGSGPSSPETASAGSA